MSIKNNLSSTYKIGKTFVQENKTAVFVALVALLFAVSRMPYINIYLQLNWVIVLSSWLGIWLFGIRGNRIFLASLGLFIVSAVALMLGLQDKAQDLANYIYFFLLAGVVSSIWRKE